jgi:adenine-specific DNA-methyltransferase
MSENKKQKLELTWIGKNNPEYDIANIEPRILEENQDYSCGDPKSENMIIHGDNLLALKALLPEYEEKIKCIYIDPPYNTGNAFKYYDDCVEHSIWLSLMKPRLELLKMLLRKDGFICCHIDDSEGQYLKVMLDEIIGRANYLTTFYVQVRYPEKTLKQDMAFHKEIEQVHIYRKDYGARPNQNEKVSSFEKFRFYIKEKGNGQQIELGGKKAFIFKAGEYEIIEKDGSADGLKEIWASGTILDGNSSGRFFRDILTDRVSKDGLGVLYKVDGIGDDKFGFRYFTGPKREGATKGKYYQGVPLSQLNNPTAIKNTPIENFYDFAGQFGNCRNEGGVEFRSGKKPELLLQTILKHFSNNGDWVLDSFMGSGTTGAVAHKMGRKYIGIEMGNQAYSHVHKRLKTIVEGSDQGGISKEVGWEGGGGFKFYELAPSFMTTDEFNNPVIDSYYNDSKLIRAMCKLMNYSFTPSSTDYWKHGKGQGNNNIYVTTQMLSVAMVQQIVSHLDVNETLLICPKKYEPGCEKVDTRITIKKIPQSILKACQFGKKEYLLPIKERPIEEIDEEELVNDNE